MEAEVTLAEIIDQNIRANGQRIEDVLTELQPEEQHFLTIVGDDDPAPVQGLVFEKDQDDKIYIAFLAEPLSVGQIPCLGLDGLINGYGLPENFIPFLRSLKNPVPDRPELFGPLTASQGAALTETIILLNLAHSSQQRAENKLRASFFPEPKESLNAEPVV